MALIDKFQQRYDEFVRQMEAKGLPPDAEPVLWIAFMSGGAAGCSMLKSGVKLANDIKSAVGERSLKDGFIKPVGGVQ